MTVQGPVKKQQPDGMSHGGLLLRKRRGWCVCQGGGGFVDSDDERLQAGVLQFAEAKRSVLRCFLSRGREGVCEKGLRAPTPGF